MNGLARQIGNSFEEFFSKARVNRAARRTGFTRRKSQKLDGYGFLIAMTLGRFKKQPFHPDIVC